MVSEETLFAKDEEVESLFERIKREQNGRLDICVNNAYAGVNAILENVGKKFYETPVDMWDKMNDVGLRNHYLCTVYASRYKSALKCHLYTYWCRCGKGFV